MEPTGHNCLEVGGQTAREGRKRVGSLEWSGGTERSVGRQDGMPRDHVGAALEHLGGIGGGVRGRAMQVGNHGPGFPAALKTDQRGIDVAAEKGHSAAGAEGTGANLCRGNTKGRADNAAAFAKCIGNGTCSNLSFALGCKDSVEWCGGRRPMEAKVFDAASDGFEGGDEVFRSVPMRDGFTFFTIFLSGELEVDAVGLIKLGRSDEGRVDRGLRRLKGNILKTEGMVIVFVVGVFARAQHVEETNDREVGRGLGEDVGLQSVNHVTYEGQWNGFDAFGRWVCFPVRTL